MSTELVAQINSLAPTALVELFELDLTPITPGTPIQRFHAGVNELDEDVVFAGNTYTALPIIAEGFEHTGTGVAPRPIVTISNVVGTIGALIDAHNELLGAKVTRIRTLAKFVDAINFEGNVNPWGTPNTSVEFAREIYYVDRKSAENKLSVEYELASSWDMQGLTLPKRKIIQNTCQWKYRGTECSYVGGDMDFHNKPSTDGAYNGVDLCAKTLEACEARFPIPAIVPYGGFPGATVV